MDYLLSKSAGYVLRILESCTVYNNMRASFCRTFSGINIENLRWSIIVIGNVIVGILLIIEGDFDSGLLQNKVRRCFTINLGRIDNDCLDFPNALELTESIISVVDLSVNEGHEVATLHNDSVSTTVRTVVRD